MSKTPAQFPKDRNTDIPCEKPDIIMQHLLRKEKMLMAIAAATNELLIKRDFIQGITSGLSLFGEVTGVDRVYLFQNGLNPETGELVTNQKVEWTSDSAEPQIDNPDLQNVPYEVVNLFMDPLSRREPFREIVRTLDECAVKDLLMEQSILSILVLPIFQGDFFWGFVGFDDCKTERIWTDDEFSILLSFAVSISAAVERMMFEKELESAKKAEQDANLAKSEFLANMSHEIRTPLNGIIGFSDLLMTMEMGDVHRQYLNNIHFSAHSLMDLINDILDFSKIEAGKLELDIEDVNIVELLEKTIEVVKYAAIKKGIRLLANIEPGIPNVVKADGLRIKQVLVNLLSNAIKFTEEGEVEIGLKAELPSKPGKKAKFHFSVRDTGIGISPDNQKKLFSAFTQADASITKKYGGTGLGLVISNKLLHMMGSKMDLVSDTGKGSDFSFILKLPFEAVGTSSTPNLEGVRSALIIDDNEYNRQILSHMLDNYQVRSCSFDKGADALAFLKSGQTCDVIITDYQMPDQNGLEMIKELRQEQNSAISNIPVILLHSSADDCLIHQACKTLNIQHKLVKPLLVTDLIEALSKIGSKKYFNPILGSDDGAGLNNVILLKGEIKLLIAEDNPVNMMLAKALIKRFVPGVKIIEAKDGNEAIESFNLYAPDFILMDIQMQEKDGYSATREIRKLEEGLNTRVPIVALTAGAVKGERERCLEAGMDEYLSKPIIREKLETILKNYLDKNKTYA
jgi:signal transduction histidine kinase/response regulator RpfG family c-di-GMP phosphodiesterase